MGVWNWGQGEIGVASDAHNAAVKGASEQLQSECIKAHGHGVVGVRVNVEVLDAETQLFNTQRDLKKARYDFLINGLKLQSAVGELDERDLEAVNRMLVR